MRQEAAKLARTMNSRHNRFTVRQWQTMKHTDLRAQQAREELERKLREQEQDAQGARPAWNSLHWSQNECAPRPTPPLKVMSMPQGHLMATETDTNTDSQQDGAAPASGTGPETGTGTGSAVAAALSAAGTAAAVAAAARTVCPPWDRSATAPAASGAAAAQGESEHLGTEDEPDVPRVARPMMANRAAEPPAEWRLRILRAKRKAMMVISVVLAFRGRKHRARGLQRLDSLAFLIAQHLGPDLERFGQEQCTYRVTRETASDLQTLAEEVWRERNAREVTQLQLNLPDTEALAAELRDLARPPSSPRSGRMPSASGSRKPQLRAGGVVSAGGAPGASSPPAAGGRAGSPLLRSRPTNLTPTLHHIPQVGNVVIPPLPAGLPAPTPLAVPGAAGGALVSPRAGTHAGHPGAHSAVAHVASSGGGAAAAAAAAGPGPGPIVPPLALQNASLPVLHGRSSARMSMPDGLEFEAVVSTATGPVLAASHTKTHRFSAPGVDPIVPTGGVAAGIAAAGLSAADDGSCISIGDVVPPAIVAAAAASPPPPSSPMANKRWQSPRFQRRGGGSGDGGEAPVPGPVLVPAQGHVALRHPQGAVNGSISSLRGPAVAALVVEDMSVISRASSWAGPSPLHALQSVLGVGGCAVGHSRSMGHDLPLSPSGTSHGGAGFALPSPPSLPSPVGRNPRQRRESGLILTACTSTASLPHGTQTPPAALRCASATGDSAPAAPATAAVAAAVATLARNSSRTGAGSMGRIASAAPSGGGNGGALRRSARVGARSATGELSAKSALSIASPYSERSRVAPSSSRRALRCNSSIRRMVRDGNSDQLYLKYKEHAAALERPLRMMQLFANRANSRWVEELAGAPPTLTQSSSSSSLTGATSAAPAPAAAPAPGPAPAPAAAGGGPGLGWEPPHVYDGSRFSASVGAAQASVFRAEVATMLRAGRLAVQVLAGDEQLVMGDGQVRALWNADPWDLIATEFPAKVAAAERVRHVYMGPRLLMALASTVEALAGPEAVAKLVVVLHVNDCQHAEVVQQLRYRRFCGLRPENLILVVQQRRPGYYWDPELTHFVEDPAAPLASAGSGYAVMQLVWPEEALQIAPDEQHGAAAEAPSWAMANGAAAAAAAARAKAAPELLPLGTSVLAFLASRGAEWLLTRRLRDISLYAPDQALDAEVLSYSLYLHEHLGANMAVQVEMVDTVTAARAAQTGIVLAPPRPRRANSTGSAAAGSGSPSGLRLGTPLPRRAGTFAAGSAAAAAGAVCAVGFGAVGVPLRVGSDVAAAWSQPESGGLGGSLHPHFVVDVKSSDTSNPRTIQLLTDLHTRAKGRLAVSTRRYLWRVDVLQSLVQRASIFHPSLKVSGDLAYLSFDLADLTSATDFGARCVAVSGARPVRGLNAATDLEELYGAVLAQDAHAPFRRLAANINAAYGPSHSALPDRSGALLGLSAAATAASLTSLSRPGTTHGGATGVLSAASGGGAHGAAAAAAAVNSAAAADVRNLHTAGQVIVVLVADNESTTMAVQLLMALVKPGRDRVVLVTVVSSILQESSGRMLLRKHEMSLMRTMVLVATELLTKNPGGSLIDQLEAFIDAVDPQLVVMGSQVLATVTVPVSVSGGGAGGGGGGGAGSSASGAAAALGSVAVSLLRSSSRPMLIVKANAKFASIAWEKDKLHVLLEVHHSSRNLLRYVCAKLVTPARQDKVFLMRGGAKDLSQQETVTSRRLLENFSDIATQYNVPVVKRALEESFDAGAIKFAEHDKAHVIAVHAPAGRGISNAAFSILRAARSAVLVYKSSDH